MDQPAMGQPAMSQPVAIQGSPKPQRRRSKGMYILPSLFTTANMAMGFYAILQVLDYASTRVFWHLDHSAIAIGFAVLFDGLDGRIARMTGTSSDFGKELDSLADAITFGSRSGAAGLDLGILRRPAGSAHRVAHQIDATGSDGELSVSDGGSEPAGALQYHE